MLLPYKHIGGSGGQNTMQRLEVEHMIVLVGVQSGCNDLEEGVLVASTESWTGSTLQQGER